MSAVDCDRLTMTIIPAKYGAASKFSLIFCRKCESNRPQEKQRDRHFNSVIERAQLGTQSTSDSAHSKETNKTVVQR